MENESKMNQKTDAFNISDCFKKPNFLVTAKYKSSLLEYKLLVYSLADISMKRNVEIDNKTGILYNRIKASEFRRILNSNSGSFYQQLDKIAPQLTGRVLGVTDPETQTFEYISIIAKTSYENGVFTIGYNPLINDWLLKVDGNFSIQSKTLLTSFKNFYTCRLYEILKKSAYYPRWKEKSNLGAAANVFEIPYSLAELKFELGVSDVEEEAVKSILNSKQNPNYEEALNICKNQQFKTWYDFRRYVLDVAVNEINGSALSDMHVEYDAIGAGRGGRIREIIFTVTLKNRDTKQDDKKLEEERVYEIDKDTVLDQISDIIDEPLKIKDIRSIAEAAEYDVEKVKNAYSVLQSYAKNKTINNVPGFMIDAIRKGSETVEKKKTVSSTGTGNAKKNKFNDFMQNEYDFEQLEAELLSN